MRANDSKRAMESRRHVHSQITLFHVGLLCHHITNPTCLLPFCYQHSIFPFYPHPFLIFTQMPFHISNPIPLYIIFVFSSSIHFVIFDNLVFGDSQFPIETSNFPLKGKFTGFGVLKSFFPLCLIWKISFLGQELNSKTVSNQMGQELNSKTLSNKTNSAKSLFESLLNLHYLSMPINFVEEKIVRNQI